MKGKEFIFDSIDILYYNLNKISLKRGGSYIDSPKWIKNKKAAINLQNNDDKCVQYPVTVTLLNKTLKTIQKDHQKSSLLLINIVGKK